ESATPSTLYSTVNSTGSPLRSFLTRAPNSVRPSSSYTLSIDSIRRRCSTVRKPSIGSPPTLCVGLSGESYSGCSASSFSSFLTSLSNSRSEISGFESTKYNRLCRLISDRSESISFLIAADMRILGVYLVRYAVLIVCSTFHPCKGLFLHLLARASPVGRHCQ